MPVRAAHQHSFSLAPHTPSDSEQPKTCFVEPLLEHINTAERRVLHFRKKQKIFEQGEVADSIYFLQKGRVKIGVVSSDGKEATLSLIGAGEFFGESCLTARPLQVHTATAMTDCSVVKITRPCMVQALREEKRLSEAFLEQILNRNLEYQQAITDHIVSSSEQRLAAILIRLCRFAQERDEISATIPRLSHQTLADMIGTTRPRVTFFMNKFRKMGLLEYNGQLRVKVDLLQRTILGG
ncbi:MAG TPA: Crp/Fnr family transcriptional regulator [Terriglobales bacterium]|nr:Crp/Fnr family transcriptional regulator [Terriglobales bacterium]